MKKAAFTFREAQLVAQPRSPAGLRLSLHRWVKSGDLLRIRREVYAFPHRSCPLPERIKTLYSPAYISLESVLNQHGLLPDVPFETTLVTPRPTRSFQTPWGRFHFHHIQPGLFFGYDSATLLAEPEKAVLDYFYFRGDRLRAAEAFWQEARFQNLGTLQWKKGDSLARRYPRARVARLWKSLKHYAKTHRSA
ncbi:MAG: hypothetical protein A2992_03425 [Elusimicrobia bacterium RIFCSPLOWO2_01_FULL_59_12]|nr:MAG: hypothetical protein A2992_03425 [Elusimicrobia bacterium RIFCSPLOWO2_01_FULL_59_12]